MHRNCWQILIRSKPITRLPLNNTPYLSSNLEFEVSIRGQFNENNEMELNKYSKIITQDSSLPGAQAMLYGIGLSEEDLKKFPDLYNFL